MTAIVLLVLLALGGLWWWRQRHAIVSENGLSMVPTGDRDMAQAIAHARENFHFFVMRLRSPQPGDANFAIKAGIEHDGQTEHIWLTDVSVDDDGFEGEIGNDPQMVPLKSGDRWRGNLSQLSDWTFFDNGQMQGNFTLRAMLPRMPRAQREQAQQMLESRWDTRELAHLPWPQEAAMPGQPLPNDLSSGDSMLMEGVSDHLDAFLGQGGQVFHELVSPSAHIDLYPHPATATRPFHVIATTGMAEQAMQLPTDCRADARVELVLLLPRSWPLDTKSWEDERHYWPFRWLKRVARFHYESGHWLGEGHVLTHGDEPMPIDPSCPFDSVLLARPRALPAEFQHVTLSDGRAVRLLCLYFLDPAARTDLAERGWEDYATEIRAERLSV
ncbi:MAG TPA: suppressor of fused domain protein [Lysobacter sp.]|nr:suppressor of fused domain protein [Lysobacter sp.]